MRVQFALCAQTASIDRNTNRLSIFNVIDQFPAATLPVIIPALTFVSVIVSDKDESTNVKGTLQVITNKHFLGGFDIPISFIDGRLARVVVNFQGVPIQEAGPVTFRLTIPEAVVAETTFQVVNISQSEALQVSPTAPAPETPTDKSPKS
jgi:hypothetical protein